MREIRRRDRKIGTDEAKTGTFVHNVHTDSRNTYSKAMHVVHERLFINNYCLGVGLCFFLND